MFAGAENSGLSKTTSHRVVLPFYIYAAISFLAATVLLLFATPSFTQHYFHPHVLAITHLMALGWGTMIILGASHQLVPVLIEGKLYSNFLAQLSFGLAAVGIPLLVYGFYVFDIGWPAQWGGSLVVVAIITYLVNIVLSILDSKRENVHAIFVLTASVWLLVTACVGLTLLFNFTYSFLPNDSLHYLSFHAHLGITGWFLLLIVGVGSRLIPMFMISKYSNNRLLWWVYFLLNGGLLCFVFIFLFAESKLLFLTPLLAVITSIILFIVYCRKAYRQRIRQKVDEQMKISLLSVLLMLIPVIVLLVVITLLLSGSTESVSLVLVYGFTIFFGWLTAIILGMTFKTLPFIVWNKVYHQRAGLGKTPNPKDLFSNPVFRLMSIGYLAGFILFSTGIMLKEAMVLQAGTVLLIGAAALYNWNVIKLLLHKPVTV